MGGVLIYVVAKAFIYNLRLKKFLAIKRNYSDHRPGIWENPGGGIRNNESVLDGIKREVLEETGIFIKEPKYLYDVDLENTNIVFKNFIGFTNQESIMLSKEHTAYKWLDIDEYLEIVEDDIKRDFLKYNIEHKLKLV